MSKNKWQSKCAKERLKHRLLVAKEEKFIYSLVQTYAYREKHAHTFTRTNSYYLQAPCALAKSSSVTPLFHLSNNDLLAFERACLREGFFREEFFSPFYLFSSLTNFFSLLFFIYFLLLFSFFIYFLLLLSIFAYFLLPFSFFIYFFLLFSFLFLFFLLLFSFFLSLHFFPLFHGETNFCLTKYNFFELSKRIFGTGNI